MIDGENLFDQPIRNDVKTYKNITKITTGHRDDYLNGCLLSYQCFKENYKMTAINLG